MVFWRNCYVAQAHLEYGWVTEGTRRRIHLMPGYQQDSSTDSVSNRIAQVQVYSLLCNSAGTDDWCIPDPPTTRLCALSL
jgi:hypothetical protein